MRIIITDNYQEMSKKAATLVASQVNIKPGSVLGLATGGTPVGMYKELVKMYQDDEVDFSEVTTFNLDEYYPIDQTNDQSYAYYMQEHLFQHINVAKDSMHIPNGKTKDVDQECYGYDQAIYNAGGIDLQVLGIGTNGHIGFNEPDITFESGTHKVTLDQETIEANARFFDRIDDVPKEAISMGMKTIMQSKKILLLANGESKAQIIDKMLFGEISPNVPASILQLHPHVIIVVDKEAAQYIEHKVK
ncbi:glucosamine-6-phosphate deaminase [Vallitalea pronyensis]|uniref:Glucosamine-6-phosphate deaminase n=1 Tax=Vallitalea pronyensis TaxID=1348613 RepID=A0A8J8MQF3_9FIRM|nr:glucosamine-6-phosphate deaminase [Vallitalea pronyensis]QUI25809.1 glucosamine-6-phosphate deaminase [Vallitalea pronyensis]